MTGAKRTLMVLGGGSLFGFGLAYSRMTRPEIVLDFLRLVDLGLILVLGLASIIALLAVNFLPVVMRGPLAGGSFSPRLRDLDARVILGAIIFGVGWGISGFCPGAAIASIGTGNYPIIAGVAAMFLGAYVHGALASARK